MTTKRATLGDRATKFAFLNYGRDKAVIRRVAHHGYMAGWLAANRCKYAELRVTVEHATASASLQRSDT